MNSVFLTIGFVVFAALAVLGLMIWGAVSVGAAWWSALIPWGAIVAALCWWGLTKLNIQ